MKFREIICEISFPLSFYVFLVEMDCSSGKATNDPWANSENDRDLVSPIWTGLVFNTPNIR